MKFWQRSLKTKLLVVFLLLSIVPTAVIGYMAYESGRDRIVRNKEAHLKSVAVLKKQEIDNWLKHVKHTVAWLASNPQVAADAADLAGEAPEDPAYRSAYDSLVAEFRRVAALGLLSPVFLLSPNEGRILASSDPGWEGQFREDKAWFTRGRSGTYVSEFFHSLPLGRPTMVVSAPVTDGSGQPVGVLAGHINPDGLKEIMLERGGLGETGETYLVNKGNLMLTESRQAPGAAFRKWAFTQGVKRALAGRSGVGLYRDYRGKPVIGAYLWLENMEAALLAEMDQSEALAPVVGLRNTVLAVGALVALLAALLAVLVSRAITSPVQILVRGAAQIGGGNLAHRVEVESRDEIGRLADAFNRMAQNLTEVTASRDELDKEVAERRRAQEELRSANQQLEAANQQLKATEQQLRAANQQLEAANQQLEASNQQLEASNQQMRATETALRNSEERLQRAIAEAPFPAMILAEDGKVVMINAEWTRITGYRHEEIPTIEAWTEKAYGERQSVVHAVIDELYGASEHTYEGDFKIRCLDGSTRIWSFRSTPLGADETGRRQMLSMAVDITERESLESQLRQAQKMESVGRLAGGVAHDYNNMLSVILGYTELALDKVTSDEPLRGDLEEVHNAARRTTDITRQLLAFARRQTIAPKVIDLNEAVEGMLNMLRRLIGEDINLSWQPDLDRMPVFMDPAQLDQILANLMVNARDAIGGVGRVTLETDWVSFDEEYCADHAGFIPGEFIMLAVSDDGCGIDKETLDNIFEPFFTTKGVGKGTGLGLSTVYGIVKQNDGFINVYSEPGKGTTFRIYLPPHEGEAGLIEAQDLTETPTSRGETVLIVEDEVAILKLAQRILERLGYAVLAVATPGEAVALAEARAGEIHLLITDVVMPEMNGRELADRLCALFPDIKTLFMSGYTANAIAHRGVLEEGVNFIQKPVSTKDLGVKARATLDQK